MKFYEVANDYIEKLELIREQGINAETGEITEDKNQITIWEEEIKTDLINKSQNLIAVIRNQDLTIDAIDKEIERLNKLKDIRKKNLTRFKDYIKNTMLNTGIEKIETPLGKISLTKSTSTEIFDEKLIDKKFIEIETKEKISKTKIKEAIKAGEEVQGARLVENRNLKIG